MVRPKRRWIGVDLGGRVNDFEEAVSLLEENLSQLSFRLVQFDSVRSLGILCVSLEDVGSARGALVGNNPPCSLTISGKIRLVRERLNLPSPQKSDRL